MNAITLNMAPVADLIEHAINAGVTFERNRWGRWGFRASPASLRQPAVVGVVVARMDEIGEWLDRMER